MPQSPLDLPSSPHQPPSQAVEAGFAAALAEARRYEGATAPNPPVGAAALDASGNLLGVAAHPRAGAAHAEAALLAELGRRQTLPRVAALLVTLEPCNHQGRTPPCCDAILGARIPRVFYGTPDPNPQVAGGGAERLARAGVEVHRLENPELRSQCALLVAPFVRRVLTGLPWVTVKQAVRPLGLAERALAPDPLSAALTRSEPGAFTMVPPSGSKTFTSQDSLRLAHELRRRSDAILTGSGTILADRPWFTVREVPDHPAVATEGGSPAKRRWLSILDRGGRVEREAPDWLAEARARGFLVHLASALEPELRRLASAGVNEVLVEAGPRVTDFVLRGDFWSRHVLIRSSGRAGAPDEISDRLSLCSQELLKKLV